MPADGPVNVTKQSIYAAIPFFDMYSAYHIKKLRLYLLVIFAAVVVPQIVAEMALFGGMLEIPWAFVAFLHAESEDFEQGVYIISWTVGGIALSVALIRHWSGQWNKNWVHMR